MLVVTNAEFHRLEASWRSLSQLSDPSLTLTALMHAYEAAFVSLGRHAVMVPEAFRVSVFLQALTQRNKDYLGLPGSPLRGAEAAPTFRECCGWLRTFERVCHSPEELLLEHTRRFSLGAAPVVEATCAPGQGFPRRASGRGNVGRNTGRHGPRRAPAADDRPWGVYGSSPRLCCVRCHQRGHAALCRKTVMKPAEVHANVLKS